MDKRTLIAIAVAFAIIFAYQVIMTKYYKPEPKKVQEQAQVKEKEKPSVPAEVP